MRETARDMPGTLKRIADLGYDGFEFLGFFGHSAEEISRWCQEAGLRPYGCFARLDELAGIKCDVAMVPIGGTYTMTAEEAAGLINKMKPEYVVPTHYGSIVGSPEDADTFEANIDEGIKVVRKL